VGVHGGLNDAAHAAGRPLARPPVLLTGIDAMRLTAHELALLERLAGISVEIDGTPANYRDVDDLLEICVSTHGISGERDWLDLGVTINVEGRRCARVVPRW
jgi:hypothetical protein